MGNDAALASRASVLDKRRSDDRGIHRLSRHHVLAIGLGTVLIGSALAAYVLGATQGLSLQTVLAERQTLRLWTSQHAGLAALCFVAFYVAVTAAAIPGAAVLSLLGGFLFGRWLGTTLVVIGATLGAAIVFSIARSALGEPLRRRAGPLYDKVSAGVTGNAVEVLLFLRFVPLFPFFLVNLVAALFDLRLTTFLVTTAVGIAPAAFIYNSIGREVGTVSNPSGLMSPGALLALLGLAGLSLLPVLLRSWRPWARPGGRHGGNDGP